MQKETRNKILTCIMGTIFTLSVCFMFEGKTVETQGKVKEGVFLPVITYKNIDGEESDYLVTAKQFEKDLAFLKEKGYNSVVARDLVSFTMGLSKLPENPVFITFDGGYRSFYSTVLPILEKYEMKATVNVVGEYTDFYSKDVPKDEKSVRLSWEEVKFLSFSPFVEIGNNTYAFYQKTDEGTDYREDILRLQQKFCENIYKSPIVFSYPCGFFNEETEKVVRDLGFKVTLSQNEGKNFITKDKKSLLNLKRYERKNSEETEEFFGKIL